jgi:hypothetical protein
MKDDHIFGYPHFDLVHHFRINHSYRPSPSSSRSIGRGHADPTIRVRWPPGVFVPDPLPAEDSEASPDTNPTTSTTGTSGHVNPLADATTPTLQVIIIVNTMGDVLSLPRFGFTSTPCRALCARTMPSPFPEGRTFLLTKHSALESRCTSWMINSLHCGSKTQEFCATTLICPYACQGEANPIKIPIDKYWRQDLTQSLCG